jgi:hypothetical protein
MTVKVKTGKMEKIKIREKTKKSEARTLIPQVLISPSFFPLATIPKS